jgi:hypothetical protein
LAGDYPQVMKDMVGSRLPSFTEDEKGLLLANLPDYFFLNHYTSTIHPQTHTHIRIHSQRLSTLPSCLSMALRGYLPPLMPH